MPLTVRGNVLSTLTRLQLLVQDGTAAAPSIAFTNRPQSGLYRAGAGAVGIAVDGVEIVRISSAGLTSTSFSGNGSQLTGIGNLSVSNIQITDSGFMPIDDTAVSNSGGYCLVNGTGFREPLGMLLGASIAPTSVTIVSQTQARVQTPAMPNGTYPLWVFTDTSSTIKNAALHVSPVPIWSTSTTLANVYKYTQFTQSLVATEPLGSNITYTLASGSSLPANVSLTSNGVVSGNILTDPGNTTTYNFTVQATDTQFQNIPRTFGLTALLAPITATGGTVTYSDVYTIHTFTTSATFMLSSNPLNRTFEVLVVAGGGGGGNRHGGGGGAGGVIYNTAFSITVGSYAVTIGQGGGTSGGAGLNGANSVLSTLTAIGGGGGGGVFDVGAVGGSGGGQPGGTSSIGGAGTSGQGTSGGSGSLAGAESAYAGGGGGGAGAVGGNATQTQPSTAGNGGIGRIISITGSAVYYGGGGGGGCAFDSVAAGSGGMGGGGAGSKGPYAATSGTPNTGGGGGGSGFAGGANGTPGNGGSGIVVIRYIT